MICSNCGTINSEEAAFCKNCGASLITQEVQKTETQETESSIIGIIKKIASSGLFMAGAICLSIYAFLQLISAFSGSFLLKYFDFMTDLALVDSYDYETELMSGVFDVISTVFTSVSLIGLIPVALMVAGVWYFYSSSKNGGQNVKGLNIIKGTLIYDIVILSVINGIALLSMIVLIAVLGSETAFLGEPLDIPQAEALSSGIIVFIFALLFIVIAASFVINLLVYLKALKTVKSVKEAFVTDTFSENVSTFLIVMLFIMGASNALSFSLTGLSLGAAYIIFGICLNQLREKLSRQTKTVLPEI